LALKFPDSADSADLAAAGYSQVIILGGGDSTATTWTIPEGVDSFSIMAIGAGGAAGYSNSTSAGGGGGGGGLAYLNNIAVTQGDQEIISITVGGGQLGVGANSDGGDATDLTVTMNLTTANPALNLSGYNINPYGQQEFLDADSDAKAIMYIGAARLAPSASNLFDSYPTLNLIFDDSASSTADQFVYVQPTGSFGTAYPFSVGVDGAQTLFDIANEGAFSRIQSLAEPDPNTTNRWGYNPATFNYASDPSTYLFKRTDTLAHLGTDSDLYIPQSILDAGFATLDDQPTTVLGTIDSFDVGGGAFTLFSISSAIQSIQIGNLPGQSPYVDSGGTIIISAVQDPSDYQGYGPPDLRQILIEKNLTP